MKRKIIFIALALMLMVSFSLAAATPVTGIWKIVDDKTGEVRSLINIYSNGGKIYGKLIASYDKGVLVETINNPDLKATKLPGSPFFNGLDIVYDMTDTGKKWQGSICDPEAGKFYDCDIWWDDQKGLLIVQGKLRGTWLGRKQYWVKSSAADLPAGFVMPNMVPNVPQE